MITLNVISNSLAILAFVVAFYTLFARERKTPYITNYIFPPAAWMLIAIVLVLIQQLASWWRTGYGATQSLAQASPTRFEVILLWGATACFYVGVLRILFNVWRLHNRQVNFRDDNLLKNLRIIRWIKNKRSWLRTTPSYEHNPPDINFDNVRAALNKSGLKVASGVSRLDTMGLYGYSLRRSDPIVTQLTAALLAQDWLVQYTTCCRHPYEFINALRPTVVDWTQRAGQIAVVDGYTPHFGFTDSIHARRTAEVKQQGISYLATPESFAGVHTATAKAFNRLKTTSGGTVRRPTLLVYEGCHALTDLESVEQYRLFLRHVLTSERMWGGMLTLFLEPELDVVSIQVLKTYSDYLNEWDPLEVKDAQSNAAGY